MTVDDDLTERLETALLAGQAAASTLTTPFGDGGNSPGNSGDAALQPYSSSLEDWVASVFTPTFVRRSTPTFRWCGQWWRHPEAISRLEALWRTWEVLRLDPLLGMANWYRDHLDHQLPVLTAAAGPFADCDPSRHFPPETDRLAHVPAPTGWWLDANC